jgi:D-beta-D-heptose 7-phosphate kinase/D-beta-D-heptose 1-phosphate adenosyltransferase
MPALPSFGLTRERIADLAARVRGRRIVVVGDVMLDRYLLGDTERLSPEAPVPVVHVRETRMALGGAANVAANVAALGATVRLVGVVGDDTHGNTIRAELAQQRLPDAGLLTVAGRPTTTKTRVVARSQQIVRIDEEVDVLLDGAELERLALMALAALEEADALLLEDYNKGALAPRLIRRVIDAAKRKGLPIIVDPKFRQFFDYAGATIFKPNRRELEAALGAATDLEHRDALPTAPGRLGVDNLLLTLGADGMVLVTKDGVVTHIPSLAREVFDVSGAGDTVTAWTGTMLAAGASLTEAALLATYAAGIEVGKSGVATVTADEVLALHDGMHDRLGMLRRGGVI